MPSNESTALNAPPLVKMNRKTTLTATELVTEGKKNAVRKKPLPRSTFWLTTRARKSASTVWVGTTIRT